MFSNNQNNHNYKPVSIGDYDSDENNNNYNNIYDPNEDYIQRQINHQKLELQRQDQGLENLSESASRLGQLSLNIHEELNHQNKMLDEMEYDLDKTSNDLNILSRKTKEFIKKSGGKRNCMIIVGMSLVVILLLFLIIYT